MKAGRAGCRNIYTYSETGKRGNREWKIEDKI
jgi:hypothetical protein